MAPVALSDYLDTIRHNLRLDNIAEREVLRELRAHIEDKLEELKRKRSFRRGSGQSLSKADGLCQASRPPIIRSPQPGYLETNFTCRHHHICYSLCYLPSAGGR